MAAQAQVAQLPPALLTPHWSLISRVAFRLCFVYFALYCLLTQIIAGLFPIPNFDIPDPGRLWPFRQITFWAASRLFHAKLPLVYAGSGSGDKTFDWVQALCLLAFAAVATCIWSALDRHRQSYPTLHKWFRLFLRFALAGQMIVYGMDKAIPLQMPFPYLVRLLEPFGNFSPMGVLWASVGSSPAYEVCTGCAELLAGILLFVPRTTMLGALVCLADATLIFVLNMTYDVPVKLFSFHLILMALLLLAPEFQRLADFFLRNRTVNPSTQIALFATRRANTIALAAQIAFGISLLAMNAYGSWGARNIYGAGRPKSPLYGIWNVERLSIDGQLRSPLLTDHDGFQRAVFDFPNKITFQRMDGSFAPYSATINSKDKTIALTKGGDKNWKANFTFQRLAVDHLTLAGTIDGHTIDMRLELFDQSKFLLVNRGFHWVQEYPFNR
jgi:hypothetical protein